MEKIELLAPAGDLERLKINLLYGADAVYFGGRNFSLRANALNFSIPEMKEAALFAHSLGKKVYVTVNIVFHDKDLEGLEDYLITLDDVGIDAIIASDPVVMDIYSKHNFKYELHENFTQYFSRITSISIECEDVKRQRCSECGVEYLFYQF